MINPLEYKIDYTEISEQMGYAAGYRCEDGKIQNLENKKWYSPDDIKLVETFGYEGVNNSLDDSLLYIIEAHDGSKGSALVPYGADHNSDLAWFLQQLPANHLGDHISKALVTL